MERRIKNSSPDFSLKFVFFCEKLENSTCLDQKPRQHASDVMKQNVDATGNSERCVMRHHDDASPQLRKEMFICGSVWKNLNPDLGSFRSAEIPFCAAGWTPPSSLPPPPSSLPPPSSSSLPPSSLPPPPSPLLPPPFSSLPPPPSLLPPM